MEETQVASPKETEEAMIDEATQKAADPLQVAQYLYRTYYPAFIEGIGHLSARGKAKVLESMVDFPFNPDKYNGRSELEKNIMIVGNTLLEAKAILQMESFKGNIKQEETKE